MPDSTASITPIGGGSGGGAATSIVVGNPVTGGAANQVLFEDGSQNLASNSNLKFVSTTGLQVSNSGGTTNVTIGSATNAATGGTGGTSVVIGNGANNNGNAAGTVAIGSGIAFASNTGANCIGIGIGTTKNTAAQATIQIGNSTTISASGNGNVVIGNSAGATGSATDSIVLGTVSTTSASNTFVAGGNGFGIFDVFFGKGVTNATAAAYTIHGTGGSGADNVGGDVILAAGQSTGAGAPANTKIQSTLVAGSSSTPQTLVDTVIFNSGWQRLQRGEVALNANYTNATAAFTSTNLSVTVVSGRTYRFTACLFFSDSTAADGAQFDFAGGSAAATNFVAQATASNNVGAALAITNAASTTLATAIQVTLALTSQSCLVVEGSFVPSGAGTFIVRGAQTAHTTGTLTIQRGSYLTMADVTAV